ncbi:hypothetical protein [Paenibacillus sp. FSL R7-0652]|uniref:Flp pilus assembly protein RcpC/CpaB domain-containing protein n=1 Tax=Paenibacillus sp. AN1007 TaxID=3151385 RepID=A0AAU8NMI2_9BACL
MKKNRVFTLLVSSLFVLSVVGCSSTSPAASPSDAPITVIASEDYPNYSSIDALTDRADTIVKGRVIQTRIEALNDKAKTDSLEQNELGTAESAADEQISFDKIYTIYTVQVAEPYKGRYTAGDQLEVKQLGGQLGSTKVINDDNLQLLPTKDYVLFLETYADTPASLLNSVQSLYVVKPAPESNQPSELSETEVIVSAHPENNLTLSLNDLQQIKDEQSTP